MKQAVRQIKMVTLENKGNAELRHLKFEHSHTQIFDIGSVGKIQSNFVCEITLVISACHFDYIK